MPVSLSLLNSDSLLRTSEVLETRPLHVENEYYSAGTKRSKRSTVRFADEPVYEEIPNREDISSTEKEACWYSKQDYFRIKCSFLVTVRVMATGRAVNGKSCYGRGLEPMTVEGCEQRQLNKKWHREAVLEEQYAQALRGVRDSVALAAVAEEMSYSSKIKSQQMAEIDEEEARKVYMSPHSDVVCQISTSNQRLDKRCDRECRERVILTPCVA